MQEKITWSIKSLLSELSAMIQDRGELSQAYQEVTNRHLLQVERVSVGLSEKIEDAKAECEKMLSAHAKSESDKISGLSEMIRSDVGKLLGAVSDLRKDIEEATKNLDADKKVLVGLSAKHDEVERKVVEWRTNTEKSVAQTQVIRNEIEDVTSRLGEVKEISINCNTELERMATSLTEKIRGIEEDYRKKKAELDILRTEYGKIR